MEPSARYYRRRAAWWLLPLGLILCLSYLGHGYIRQSAEADRLRRVEERVRRAQEDYRHRRKLATKHPLHIDRALRLSIQYLQSHPDRGFDYVEGAARVGLCTKFRQAHADECQDVDVSLIADWAASEGLARREDFYSPLDDLLYRLRLDRDGLRVTIRDSELEDVGSLRVSGNNPAGFPQRVIRVHRLCARYLHSHPRYPLDLPMSVIADWAVQEGLARREDFYSYLDDKLYKLELDPNGHRFSVWDADHSGWTGEL
jgi:hypothetical protein